MVDTVLEALQVGADAAHVGAHWSEEGAHDVAAAGDQLVDGVLDSVLERVQLVKQLGDDLLLVLVLVAALASGRGLRRRGGGGWNGAAC